VRRPGIPVITLLYDLMASGKGPYRRLVGKHTQQFCSRADSRSTNEIQKKILFIAAAGADDFVSKLLGIQPAKQTWTFSRKIPNKNATPKKCAQALRTYLSALMIILAAHKELLLQKAETGEAEWLKLWCTVFEYAADDKTRFDSELLPAYQLDSIESLVRATGSAIFSSLCPDDNDADQKLISLNDALVNDAAVILGAIQ
jgi:hypothetical protein